MDVFKPVASMGGGLDTSGQPLYQPVTVTLRGGMQFWRVTAYRVWSVGTFSPPAPEYVPGTYEIYEEPIDTSELEGMPYEAPTEEPSGVDILE